MKEQYLKEVSRLLPRKVRRQVLRDLEERFQTAEEHGEPLAEVMARLGAPAEFAAPFREGRRSSLIPPLLLGTAGLLAAVWSGTALFLQRQLGFSISGVIGGSDGPTEIVVSQPGPNLFLLLLPLGLAVLAGSLLWLRKRMRKF